VVEQVGERSYVLGDKRGSTLPAHADQLKPYQTLGEVGELLGLGDLGKELGSIMGLRDGPTGRSLLVSWKGDPGTEASWVAQDLLESWGFRQEVATYLASLGGL
jgi:hypothetical protein